MCILHLYNYMVTNQQSGLREDDSTSKYLLHTYHTMCEAVDKGKAIQAVLCDISKIFDRVWHKGLLYKLHYMRFSNRIVKWFASYLSEHRQRAVINDQSSDWVHSLTGAPQ